MSRGLPPLVEDEADYPLDDDDDDIFVSKASGGWSHNRSHAQNIHNGRVPPQVPGRHWQGERHVQYGRQTHQPHVREHDRAFHSPDRQFHPQTGDRQYRQSSVGPDYHQGGFTNHGFVKDEVARNGYDVNYKDDARQSQDHVLNRTPSVRERDRTSEPRSPEHSQSAVTNSLPAQESAIGTQVREVPERQPNGDVALFPDDVSSTNDVNSQPDDDLANLEYLDNDILMDKLRTRYDNNQPYTYIGDCLVAINPCRDLDIYTQEYHDKYRDSTVRSNQPPHIFWIASQVYRNLVTTGSSQCVVVGGDSGAGKTESTKFILNHLVRSGSSGPTAADAGKKDGEAGTPDIVAKLEKVNPLLEVFGNAATVLNENSSRFGKLVELEYDGNGVLNTARLECFILEKFRVTSRHPLEKTFHVFYSLFAGLPRQRLEDLNLEDAETYRILRPGNPTDPVFQSTDDMDKYRDLYTKMDAMLADVGFTETEVSSLYQCLAAILHIANVEFEQDPDSDTVMISDGIAKVSLANAADVLGVDDWEELETCLLTVNMEVKGERMVKFKSERQARDGRDALARELYSVLFYGVIDRINRNLQAEHGTASSGRKACIRLLDISGFENVAGHNGFEQFVINATNEKLHQYFLDHTFTQEKREYEQEGLKAVDIAFADNKHIVDLIFKKPDGLIPLLEDINAVNGTDDGWLNKCRSQNHSSPPYNPTPNAKVSKAFAVTHYAGQVVYSADGFVEKNSDTLPHNLRETVLRSDNTFITDYFSMGSDAAASLHKNGRASFRKSHSVSRRGLPAAFARANGESRKRTGKLSGRFTDQYQISLSRMMNKLQTATPVFVRCIKPNLRLKSGHFDSDLVRSQLLSNGLLEVTQIRKDGYPIRIKFADFVKRYKEILDHQETQKNVTYVQMCQTILAASGVQGYQTGHAKVFLKMHHRDQLEATMARKKREREQERERQERERLEKERRERESREGRQPHTEGEDDGSLSASNSHGSGSSESGFSSASGATTSHVPDGVIIKIGESTLPDISEETAEEEKRKKKKEKERKEGAGNQPAYNIFRLTERDFEYSKEFEMKARRCVRFVLYVIIFILILGGGVVARVALLWLGSAEFMRGQTSDTKLVLGGRPEADDINTFEQGVGPARLLVCQLIPLIIGWLSCVLKVMFGSKDWPTLKALVVVALIDSMGTVGRSVFIFKVLPKTDFLTATILGTAVCQVPGLMKVTSSILLSNSASCMKSVSPDMDPSQRRWLRVRHYVYQVLLVLSVLVQLGAVPLLVHGDEILSSLTTTTLQLPGTWWMVVVILCVSVGWWENYAYGGITVSKRAKDLATWRLSIGRIRQTSYVYTGPVQMVIVVALFFAFNDTQIDMAHQTEVIFTSFGRGFSDVDVLVSHFTVYGLMYLQIVATFICAYFSGIACRLYMQRMGFALPVNLVAPVAMALVVSCEASDNNAPWFDIQRVCSRSDLSNPNTLYLLVLGGAVWLSTVVINGHVWCPEVERTAKMERLFAFPHRDPVFPDICLECARRQDREENAEWKRRHKKSDGKSKEGADRPKVYICATMWHEVRQEMRQLLKSIFRIDFDVYTRKKAMTKFNLSEEHSDLYEPEIHIIFDDAFETEGKSKQRVLNSWVRQFIDVMPEALASVAKRTIDLQPPTKTPTPYGGRLIWILPGGTRMEVHLKDKDKIRHRKRWSQILYLYYILGFKLMGQYDTVSDVLGGSSVRKRRRRRHRVRKTTSILNNMPSDKVREADNIFLMALDGDVDFRPDAVHLLLDRMKKNKKVAAVCGRIHPIGDGPMVWYQQFEYSVGHWLQKAAEHVFGCVLCCPGCFSLFRGSALMDDNVMRMYTTEPTEAIHFIQYEQGEDRWLCTLLLQQGWKIEYCAGADALTYAPETFHDFYIQRRRWSPSTMANIIDLIGSWRITVKMNDNISVLFMLYQFLLLTSSVVAPGLVVFMIAGSYNTVLKIGLWESYLLSVLPVFLYVLLCLKAKTATQINIAAIMSSVYAIVMLLVTIGTVINVATASILSPDVLFLICLSIIFVIAGIVHPNELFCLGHGILYYLTVPSTFVFLTVFFLCNLHVVTWGTREGPKKVDPAAEQQQQNQAVVVEKGKLYKFFEKLGLHSIVQDVKSFIQQIMGIRQEQQPQNSSQPQGSQLLQQSNAVPAQLVLPPLQKEVVNVPPPVPPKPTQEEVVEPDHTYWTRQLDIPESKVGKIGESEEKFWQWLLEEYLHPIKANKEKQEKITADLISARNNVVFAYMLVNLMFTLVLLQLRLQRDVLIDTFYIAGEYEPASTLALGVFSLLLLTQFAGMLGHRWGTFMHLIASTKLNFFHTNEEEERALAAIQEAQQLTSAGAEGDLGLDPVASDEDEDLGDGMTTVPSTPRPSTVDLQTLGRQDGGDADIEAPDYSDDEEAPDYSDSEGETEFNDSGDRHVQYDDVFDQRYKTVRRHLERGQGQGHTRRAPLYVKQQSAAVSKNRYQREISRRQSLYQSVRHDPRQRRNSFFNV